MTNQNGIHSLNSENIQKKLNNNTGRAPLTKPQQKQLNQHLLHQLNNDARGNIANQDAARGFRQAMDNAFITAIPNDNARFRSCIRNGVDLQQQFFDQRKENTPPPSLSFDLILNVNFQPHRVICTYLIWAHEHTPLTWLLPAIPTGCLLLFATVVDEMIITFLKPINAVGI